MAEDSIPADIWLRQQIEAWQRPVLVEQPFDEAGDYEPMNDEAWEFNAPEEGLDGAVECVICGALAYSVAAGACLECGAGNE